VGERVRVRVIFQAFKLGYLRCDCEKKKNAEACNDVGEKIQWLSLTRLRKLREVNEVGFSREENLEGGNG